MIATTVTLGSLVSRALLDVMAPEEVPRSVVLASGALTAVSTDNAVTLADASTVNISDLLEFGSEMLLVTAKSADATPILTVQRGYYGTLLAVHAVLDVGYQNPSFPRYRVAEAVRRSFSRLEALGIPSVTSGVFNIVDSTHLYVSLPANTRQVYSVRYAGTTDGHFYEVDRWKFQDDLPTIAFPTGKVLSVGWYIQPTDNLIITYRIPYRWSSFPTDPSEAATISLPEGVEDLPAIYAAAWLASKREISRTQLARSQEWNDGEPFRNGVSQSLVRVLWTQFYADIDAARKLYTPPIMRPYRKLARL
jgi:hypothetical protein